jgi:hypothetical protein
MHTAGPVAFVAYIDQPITRQLTFAVWPLGSQTIHTTAQRDKLQGLQHRICLNPPGYQAANGQAGFAPDEQGALGAIQRLRYLVQRGGLVGGFQSQSK